MVEIAISQSEANVVLVRWDGSQPYMAVHPDGAISRAEPSGVVIPVWDAAADRDLDVVVNDVYAAAYAKGHADGRNAIPQPRTTASTTGRTRPAAADRVEVA